MKVCTLCNEIVADRQGCAEAKCPNKVSARLAKAKLESGSSDQTDHLVQASMDKLNAGARRLTRKAAFAVSVIMAVLLAAGAVIRHESDQKFIVKRIDFRGINAADSLKIYAVGLDLAKADSRTLNFQKIQNQLKDIDRVADAKVQFVGNNTLVITIIEEK